MDLSKLEEPIRKTTRLLPTFRENEDLIAIFDCDNIITLSFHLLLVVSEKNNNMYVK